MVAEPTVIVDDPDIAIPRTGTPTVPLAKALRYPEEPNVLVIELGDPAGLASVLERIARIARRTGRIRILDDD